MQRYQSLFIRYIYLFFLWNIVRENTFESAEIGAVDVQKSICRLKFHHLYQFCKNIHILISQFLFRFLIDFILMFIFLVWHSFTLSHFDSSLLFSICYFVQIFFFTIWPDNFQFVCYYLCCWQTNVQMSKLLGEVICGGRHFHP